MAESVSDLLGTCAINIHPVTLDLLLPVGISFYTFQTLSYVIDVYGGGRIVKPNIILVCMRPMFRFSLN